jgi:RNA polymerase sigma factor for flagellar operon FliA
MTMTQLDAATVPAALTPAPWLPSYRPSAPPRRASTIPAAPEARRSLKRVKERTSTPPKSAKAPVLDARSRELLLQYTPLVQRIAGGFRRKLPHNVLKEDLVAAGMVGLWDAIRRHGADGGEGFEWYVRVRVRGAILDELRAQDWLSRRARAAVTASRSSMPPAVIRIENVGEWEQARCLVTPASSDTEVDEKATRQSLALAIAALPERERLIVSEHYFNDVKFKHLGAQLGVSEPRVSQLHSRAMRMLRDLVANDD